MSIVIPIQGGLGNQLFQIATGIGLGNDTNSNLVLDPKINYELDFRYRRRFEFAHLAFDVLPRLQSLALFALSRYFIRSTKLDTYKKFEFSKSLFFHVEDCKRFNQLDFDDGAATHILFGYWQSPRYFERHNELIFKLLIEPLIERAWTVDSQLREFEVGDSDIAVGIRFYEETPNPLAHADSRNSESYSGWMAAIEELVDLNPIGKLHLFTTLPEHNLVYLIQQRFGAQIVTLKGSLQRLIAFSMFNNYVFNNSSFYWWGCYTRHLSGGESPARVLCSNNFKNRDTYLDHWRRFS